MDYTFVRKTTSFPPNTIHLCSEGKNIMPSLHYCSVIRNTSSMNQSYLPFYTVWIKTIGAPIINHNRY